MKREEDEYVVVVWVVRRSGLCRVVVLKPESVWGRLGCGHAGECGEHPEGGQKW